MVHELRRVTSTQHLKFISCAITKGVWKYSYAEYHDCETCILHAQQRQVDLES